MKESFPRAHVHHIQEVNPNANKDAPTPWKIWARAISERVGSPVSYVFASESYGTPLAEQLGASFISVDKNRNFMPISSTQIRENPWNQWDFLLPSSKAYFCRRLQITVPENQVVELQAALLAERIPALAATEFSGEADQMPLLNSRYEAMALQSNSWVITINLPHIMGHDPAIPSLSAPHKSISFETKNKVSEYLKLIERTIC